MKKCNTGWLYAIQLPKIDLKMRLTTIMLVVSLLKIQANTYSQNTKLTLNVNDVSVEQVIDEIESISEFRFLFESEQLDLNRRVSVNVKKATIRRILNVLFKNTGIEYKTLNRQILLTKSPPAVKKKVEQAVVKEEEIQFTVSGLVTDVDLQPLPGANIVEKGTSNGTQTDFDGNFTINVADANAILIVSYIGFETKEVPLSGRSSVNVPLAEDAANLEEVIVVGYGTQKRETLAGAVDQVTGAVLESRPITNSINGLQGALPGLNITRSSGQPGNEGYNLNIRGVSSANGSNQPLVLIDGVEGDLNLLNPNDIKTISILKDAAASIYGSRAAFGVVLVTTKTGKAGQKLKINYTTNFSVNRLANLLDRVNTREWIEMDWEAKTNGMAAPQFQDASVGNNTLEDVLAKYDAGMGPEIAFNNPRWIFNYTETDWDNIIYDKVGYQQSHNLTFTGGGEQSRFNASFGYIDTNGVFRDTYDDSERYNVRINYGIDPFEKLKLNFNLSYNNQSDVSPAFDSGTIIDQYNKLFRWLPETTADGEYITQWGFANPRVFLDKDFGKTTKVTEQFRANVMADLEVLDGLNLHGQAAVDRVNGRETNYRDLSPRTNWNGELEGFWNPGGVRNSFRRANDSKYLNLTGYLKYEKLFADKHNISATAGASHEEKEFGFFWANARGLDQAEVPSINLGDPELTQISESRSDWAIKSYFARANYTFDGKYIAEYNFRRDGTSIFSPDVRWGNFSGVALAWRASEEEFVKNLNFFDNLKLRASRGTAGNQNLNENNLNFYDYIARVNVGNIPYSFGGSNIRIQGASEAGLVSPQRTWEDIETTNFGADFAFFDSRLSGRFDWFDKKNKNMQVQIVLPETLGGVPPTLNIGTLRTKGFELSLTWSDTTKGGFTYSLNGFLSDAQDELTDLNGLSVINLGPNRTVEGYALNTNFGYVYDGVLETQEEVDAYTALPGVPTNLMIGDARYKDLNGDGQISVVDEDGNLADAVSYGSNAPRYSYTFNGYMAYKGLDFSIFLQGVGKRDLFYRDQWRLPFEAPWWQPLRRFYNNTWSPERPSAKYPRLTSDSQRYWNFERSQNTLINGAYLRVKNITLGYSLPQSVLDKMKISNLRIFLSGEDLFTFSQVDGGYDPENTNGFANFYPFTKRYSLGLSVDF